MTRQDNHRRERARKLIAISLLPALALTSSVGAENKALTRLGDAVHEHMPMVALVITGAEGGTEALKESGLAYLGRRFTVPKFKDSVEKPRPDGSNNRSFPSSHTASAFGAASTFHARYGFEAAAAPYALAVLTGISRVQARKHYPEDVIAGAMVGMAWSFSVVSPKVSVGTTTAGGVSVAWTTSF